MTLAYKVEELLALRDSVSESAVSIDRFADEDVIKEHVLRPSASACLISARSDNSSRPLAAPAAAGTTAAAKKPSPSPSIKRGKAERLLKEHGSPPGMRVTAGGRVVPSDLPPLSSARFSANNLRAQPPQVVSPGNLGLTYPGPDNNTNKVAPHSQGLFTNNGQAYLFVDNQLVPINNGYIMAAPYNYGNGSASSAAGFTDPGSLGSMQMQPYVQQPRSQAGTSASQAPASIRFAPQLDLASLKQKHASKTQDLKYLEQVEVLRAPHETEEWRAATVEKKRKLVIEIDNVRRTILGLDPNAFSASAHSVPVAPNPTPSIPVPSNQVPVAPQFQQPVPPPMYAPAGLPMISPASGTFPQPPFVMYGPPFNAPQTQSVAPGQIPGDVNSFNGANNGLMATSLSMAASTSMDTSRVTGRDNLSQSPTSNRRSHAVEIKPPQDMMTKNSAQGSTLNPKSPTYEPAKPAFVVKPRSALSFLPPTPSPKPTPDRMSARASAESMRNAQQTLKPKASLSSVSTADFFPMNTHEHSLTRTGPAKPSLSKQCSGEELPGPITPDKKPWGTLPLSRSGGKSRLYNYIQSPLLRRNSGSEPFINSPLGSGRKSRFTTDSFPLSGGSPNSATRTPGEQSPWFFPAPNKTATVPSTFQEGYQAGLRHVGLPLDVEVIRGYMTGLKDLLGDLTGKGTQSNTPSRGTPSQEPPRDSGVSMSFNTGANMSATAGQENRRISTTAALPAPIKGLGQSPNSSIWTRDQTIKYVLCNEAADLPKRPRATKTDSLDKVGEAKTMKPSSNDNRAQKGQLSNPMQTEHPLSNKLVPTQFSGNQAAARGVSGFYGRQPSGAGNKESPSGAPKSTGTRPSKSAHEQRYSGFDGAMDDMQELFENQDFNHGGDTSTEASCFKPYSSKVKQKATSSPTKSSESPKKSSEQSPAKAKLEQIANSFKPNRKDDRKNEKVEDLSVMSPAEKRHWRENWRKRFVHLATREKEEVEKERAEQEYRRSRNMNQD